MDPEHRIAVNFATPRELRIIPGIGDKLAKAIVEVRLRGNVTAPLLSSILRKRIPEDILACLDFRQNPDYDTADEQQDEGYGADSLDYDDGSKAQWTEEDVYRSQIKDEIKNRLWPDGSTFPMDRGAFGGPGAPSVPWTMPSYKTATGMQEDLIHPGSIFPKQRTKSHTDDRPQSPQVRRKLNLEYSEESEGAEKKQKSSEMDKDQKATKQKTSADDSATDKQAQLSDNKSSKNKHSLSEKKSSKKHKSHSVLKTQKKQAPAFRK